MKTLPGGSSNASERVTRLLQESTRKERERRTGGTISRSYSDVDELKSHNLAQDLSKQITRRWRAGDVYAPHDLSEVEMAKWKKREKPNYDVFDILDFNPLDHYRVNISFPTLPLQRLLEEANV
jgi:small subunit ribosomal protein S18